MPSSTSSFDRPVPERPWGRLGAVALALTLLAGAGWETTVRGWGYLPSYEDTPEFWSLHRNRVRADSTVVIGSSRTVFDLDLDVWERELGVRPVHLGLVGSSPRPMLADLAADASFRGTLIVGVTPGLFFAGGGPPVEKSEEFLAFRRRLGPSDRSGGWLGRRLEERLAMIEADDLTLAALLGRIPLPERSGAVVDPRFPPSMGAMRADRTIAMSERLATDPAFQGEIQQIWQGLAAAVPRLPPETLVAIRDRVLAETAAQVATLRQRGVRVVFLRLPSTGWLRELEARALPRGEYWDRLLAATGAPGIHFEDHPELAGFPCPEWSHLTAEDATRFTRALAPHLRAALEGS